MRYRNGAHGYGLVTKALHWLTVAAILGQFLVGYSMDFGDAFDGQQDAVKAESDQREEAAEGQGEAAEARAEAESERREDAVDAKDDDAAASVFSDVVTGRAFGDGLSLPEVHVLLGLSILALAAVRILWRHDHPAATVGGAPRPRGAEVRGVAGEGAARLARRRPGHRAPARRDRGRLAAPARGRADRLPRRDRRARRNWSSATPSCAPTGTSPAWCDELSRRPGTS